MPITARERRRHPRSRFNVEVEGFGSGSFMTISGLQVNIETISHREGGKLIPDNTAGNVSFEPITLSQGTVTDDLDMYEWVQDVYRAGADTGLDDPDYKRTVDIVQLGRSGNEERRWRLRGAFPSTFIAGEWDADANENTVQSMTLTFQDFELVAGSG